MATTSASPAVWAQAVGTLPPDEVVFGFSPAMAALRRKLEKLVTAAVPVLIQGESGTGKEIICRLIHQRSPWSDGPFVKVNCPAIPSTLLESELFGYERGAFTGADRSKSGRVEQAHGGTLFLDEIAELDPTLQAKLLQLLQDGQFSRIGARAETAVKVRVICATNRNLEEEIGLGNFRQDLFYRINVVTLQLVPLRERVADIPILCDYFVRIYSEKFGRRPRPLSQSMIAVLQRRRWVGNIRELENVIKRYVILGSEEILAAELNNHEPDIMDTDLVADGSISLKAVTRRAVRELERKIIFKTLEANHWNRKQSAQALKISYRALLYKLKEARIGSREEDRSDTDLLQ
jgi:two-component system response regulator AtoC